MGSKPLLNWELHIENGRLCRILDSELKVMVLDLRGVNVSTTYMVCPEGNQELGIYMPFLVMVVKNLKKYFSFEIAIKDATGFNRRFRMSNFQSSTVKTINSVAMPLSLSDGWNQIQFNLVDFVQRAYNTQFVEVVYVKINANIRIRAIYFTDKLRSEEELPKQYRLFLPTDARKPTKAQLILKENVPPKQSIEGVVTTERQSQSSRSSVLKPNKEEDEITSDKKGSIETIVKPVAEKYDSVVPSTVTIAGSKEEKPSDDNEGAAGLTTTSMSKVSSREKQQEIEPEKNIEAGSAVPSLASKAGSKEKLQELENIEQAGLAVKSLSIVGSREKVQETLPETIDEAELIVGSKGEQQEKSSDKNEEAGFDGSEKKVLASKSGSKVDIEA